MEMRTDSWDLWEEMPIDTPFLTALSLCLALVPSTYLSPTNVAYEELSRWKLLPVIHSSFPHIELLAVSQPLYQELRIQK